MALVVFEKTAPALSELDIRHVEQLLGINLPQDMKSHYLRHNGGRPRPQFFLKGGEAYDVDRFLPMGTYSAETSFEEVYVRMVYQTPEFPRGYIPFAKDSAGDFFVYSVIPKSFGNIMYNSRLGYGDEDRFIVFLASSLNEFIKSLAERPEGME